MFLRQLFIAMTFEELKDKALSLPLEPGVYLMQDKSGQIIYVGKAKKLKNRVSQYFQNTASHTPKTRRICLLYTSCFSSVRSASASSRRWTKRAWIRRVKLTFS